jgi:5-formyltetrahydrofolate cyclo-ligase
MGRGKGYYDRFLHRYAANHPKPTLCAYDSLDSAYVQVALALTPQVLPAGEVPHDSEDEPLDGIVSPAGVQTRDGVNA